MSLSLWHGNVSPPAPLPRMAEIISRVAQAHGLTVEEMVAPSRRRAVAHARFEAAWTMRQVRWADGRQRYSLPMVAAALGGRNHSTMIYACRRWEAIASAKAQTGKGVVNPVATLVGADSAP